MSDVTRYDLDQEEEYPDGLHQLNKLCELCGKIHPDTPKCPFCHSDNIDLIVRQRLQNAKCKQCGQMFIPDWLPEELSPEIQKVDWEDGTYRAEEEPCQYCHSADTVYLVRNGLKYGQCRQCGQPFIPTK